MRHKTVPFHLLRNTCALNRLAQGRQAIATGHYHPTKMTVLSDIGTHRGYGHVHVVAMRHSASVDQHGFIAPAKRGPQSRAMCLSLCYLCSKRFIWPIRQHRNGCDWAKGQWLKLSNNLVTARLQDIAGAGDDVCMPQYPTFLPCHNCFLGCRIRIDI